MTPYERDGSQITSLTIIAQMFIQAQIKENIKTPRNWPLCGNSPLTSEFPAKKPITREMFLFDDVIIKHVRIVWSNVSNVFNNDARMYQMLAVDFIHSTNDTNVHIISKTSL